MEIIYRVNAIKDAATQVWAEGKQYSVWALHGEMGAGKTTFTHALCEILGVTSVISSPTFAIINEYNSTQIGSIYHMDWYRLKDEEEAIQAGVEDCLLSGNFCLVEWPDKAPGILPDNTFHLHIKMLDDDTRQLYSE